MVVMLVKANKTSYLISLLHQMALFYIVMFTLYLKCVFYFTISSVVGMEGWEGRFIHRKHWMESFKNILSAHYKYFCVCHF